MCFRTILNLGRGVRGFQMPLTRGREALTEGWGLGRPCGLFGERPWDQPTVTTAESRGPGREAVLWGWEESLIFLPKSGTQASTQTLQHGVSKSSHSICIEP